MPHLMSIFRLNDLVTQFEPGSQLRRRMIDWA
jgi:hypothetical protein